jgi:hypothetical protein
MQVFECGNCGARLHFENTRCLSCGCEVGFAPMLGQVISLLPMQNGVHAVAGDWTAGLWRKCHNYQFEHVCNWLVPADHPSAFCVACELNRTIPDLTIEINRMLWGKIESAKRRLIFSLLQLRLPLFSKALDPSRGLAFDFIADTEPVFAEGSNVMTGHQNGVITINLAEADDAVRERMRLNLREVYRTLLGHLRHESGHYYWDLLVRDSHRIDDFRAVFGDERADYNAALARYYSQQTPSGWETNYVTRYASAHPWEDWAETWAHYLHIIDTLQTAAAQGVSLETPLGPRRFTDPLRRDFTSILEDWQSLRIVLNSLNRSMGLPDAYPFVITPLIGNKLAFIHDWIRP